MRIPSYLRSIRRRHHLTQADIEFLVDSVKRCSLSRWERGHSPPPLEVVVAYHVLFNKPIEDLIPFHIQEMVQKLETLLPTCIERVEQENPARARRRLETLQSIRTRLKHSSLYDRQTRNRSRYLS